MCTCVGIWPLYTFIQVISDGEGGDDNRGKDLTEVVTHPVQVLGDPLVPGREKHVSPHPYVPVPYIMFKYTVKQSYSKHTYNELILIVKWFSSPVDFKHIVKITDITNYVYNEEESPVPCTSGTVVFLEYLKTNKSKCNINQDMFQNLTTETI